MDLLVSYSILHLKTYGYDSLMFGSGLVFATTAELLQLIPEGRYCCFSDMVINNSGYLAGTLIGLLFYLIIWLIKRAFKKKKGVQDNG